MVFGIFGFALTGVSCWEVSGRVAPAISPDTLANSYPSSAVGSVTDQRALAADLLIWPHFRGTLLLKAGVI